MLHGGPVVAIISDTFKIVISAVSKWRAHPIRKAAAAPSVVASQASHQHNACYVNVSSRLVVCPSCGCGAILLETPPFITKTAKESLTEYDICTATIVCASITSTGCTSSQCTPSFGWAEINAYTEAYWTVKASAVRLFRWASTRPVTASLAADCNSQSNNQGERIMLDGDASGCSI
eukprot:scaffold224459_cov15-Prasinocladus_malaysianus.AAC.1